MRLFYIFLLPLLFSCTTTPPKKPMAKKPQPDLKKEVEEELIYTQTSVNYSFIKDTLTGKISQIKEDEQLLIYDREGYLRENYYTNKDFQEQFLWYYDPEHRIIAENYICKSLNNNRTTRKLINHTYDTLGYEVNRYSYEFLDSLSLFSRYEIDYDKHGNLSNVIEYQYQPQDKKWQPFSKEVHKYNEKGLEKEKETYYHYMSLWLLKEKESFKYNRDSLIEEKFAYNYKQSNAPRRIRYSYVGQEQQLTYISEKDSITTTESYLYDHRGALSKYTLYNAEGMEQLRQFFLYTPYDKRLQEISYQGDTEQERTIYQYDVKGQLIQKTTYVQGEIKRQTQVKYSYHTSNGL